MNKDDIKIAILLLCYRQTEIVDRALSQIDIQTKKDNIIVYLVNDCSPNTNCEYQDLIQKYSNLNIKYFKTEKNSGPSIARQFGLDQIKEQYFIFNDDDDWLYDKYVIENYINLICQNQNFSIIKCPYILKNNLIEKVKNNLNENFLCYLYNKEFLDNYNIRFNKKLKRRCEDFLFLTQINYYSNLYNYKQIEGTFYNYVFYHSNNEESETHYLQNQNKNRSIDYLYEIIYFAELIKFYQNELRNNNDSKIKKDILLILKTVFKSSFFLLYFFETKCSNLKEIFLDEDLNNCYESWNYLRDLIKKNYTIIFPKYNIDYYGPIDITEDSFIEFDEQFDIKWERLTK